MTTETTHSVPGAGVPRPASGWIPRSLAAWAVLIIGLIIAAVPAVLAAGIAYLMYPACFDECGAPVEVATWYVVAALVVLAPFVAVRVYQSRLAVSPLGRLAACALIVLVPAAAVLAWFTG